MGGRELERAKRADQTGPARSDELDAAAETKIKREDLIPRRRVEERSRGPNRILLSQT